MIDSPNMSIHSKDEAHEEDDLDHEQEDDQACQEEGERPPQREADPPPGPVDDLAQLQDDEGHEQQAEHPDDTCR